MIHVEQNHRHHPVCILLSFSWTLTLIKNNSHTTPDTTVPDQEKQKHKTMKNAKKEMTTSKKKDLVGVSKGELIQKCEKGKLFWCMKKRVNHKGMPEWSSSGPFLADLKREVEASLSKGVNVEKTISKHEHTNPYAFSLEFGCQSHVSLSFMNEKATKHHRNVLVTGLSVDFRSIL